MNLKYSVIIPVYNKEKYLDKCLESIINQSLDDFEIILINDGSTDGSPVICDKWAKLDGRISVIHKENEGPALARNIGLDKALGEIISFVDADDYLDPDTYLICNRELRKNNADACYFGRRAVTAGEVVSDVVHIPKMLEYDNLQIKKEFVKFMIGALPDEAKRNYVGVSTCTVVYDRDFIERNHIRFVDVKQNEDPIFNIIVCRYAKKIIVLPDILYNNTVGFQSLTRRYDKERFEVFKQGFLETVKLAEYFPDCDHVHYRMDYKFASNVCRDIQMEMRYAKVNGYISALAHINHVCGDSMVREVVKRVVVTSENTKRMLLLKLIRNRMAIFIWMYYIYGELKGKIKRKIRKYKAFVKR